MHALILLMALVFAPAHQRVMTVAECLTYNGDSNAIYDHPELAAISGVEVGAAYEQLIQNTEVVGYAGFMTDTGDRTVQWRVGGGEVYLFVFRHKQAPGAYGDLSPGVKFWHGACMLRLTDV